MICEIPCGPTFTISLGFSLAAFQSLKAPTLLVEVIKSPEMLSTQDKEEIPVDYFSKIITRSKESTENKQIIPLSKRESNKFSPGFQARFKTEAE